MNTLDESLSRGELNRNRRSLIPSKREFLCVNKSSKRVMRKSSSTDVCVPTLIDPSFTIAISLHRLSLILLGLLVSNTFS